MYKSIEEWGAIWESLDKEELDKVAMLRIVECTNGVIQHMYRNGDPFRLTVEQTRTAMNYSMKAMKTMEIPLKTEVVKFQKETKLRLREARDLYVRAFKRNEEDAMSAFFDCSESCVRTVGEFRLTKAAHRVDKEIPDIFPVGSTQWGLQYLRRFLV